MMARTATREIFCRQCRGTLTIDRSRLPYGWLQLTVGIPNHMSSDGRDYRWIGMFCTAACLADYMSTIQEQETLARQAYEAEAPRPAQRMGGA